MLLGEISKNATEKIKIEIREYKGHKFIDCRTYYISEDEWKPTKKGITIPPDLLGEFVDVLSKANENLSK